ncbi:Peptidyl-lysine N-acetyltransferase Pat [subsurface metagenome]
MTTRFKIHKKNLKKFIYPESVAIIGANNVKGTVPHDILLNILNTGFNGKIFPVSPGEKSIAEVKAYKYVIDIADTIDLAIIVFPSSVCHLALEQCGQKGIKAVIIISAGFKEVGEAGLEREKKLKEIAEKYDMSIIGPNCLGIINTDPGVNLNASFARKMPEEGNIGFLSQSGALCTAVLDYARAKHIGFSKFISFGNKVDINEIDLLYYLGDDEKTKVILIYLEEIRNGRALMKTASDIISKRGKPILILKAGRTTAGASAAASHTGSLAGSDEICDAAFEQAGIIRCNNIEEMFNNAIAFAYQPLPENKRVAIITNTGGPGVLTTDAAIDEGLELAGFSEETTKILKKNLPATANIKNPIDVIGDARDDRYNIAMSNAFKDDNVDGVFVILTPQSMTDIDLIAHEVVKVSGQYIKPVYTSFMGEADVSVGIDILQLNKIPHYSLPENMCKSFACVYKFKKRSIQKAEEPKVFAEIDKIMAHTVLNEAIKTGRSYLPEEESVRIIESYGLPVLTNGVANSKEQAVHIADKIGYPVVMKVISDDIVHKFDVKGVVLNIKSVKEVQEAYTSIWENVERLRPGARIKGIFITKMIPAGEEVILGIKRDPSFGPVIMFGLGGIFVEIFKDVCFRVAPVSKQVASSMIQQLKTYQILSGKRGNPPRDIEAILDCIMRLSQMAVECPQIQELDINPLIVLDENKGCFVADAKIML